MNKLFVLFLSFIILSIGIGGASAEVQLSNIIEFLETDKTDENEYLPWYTCGHYTRELTYNARDHNISMGAAILSDHPVFRDYFSHIINYIEINNTLFFIYPQLDEIRTTEDVFRDYKYIRLYPDGTQVPSYWTQNFAPDLRRSDFNE